MQGIVILADSRTTIKRLGFLYFKDNAQKIFRVDNNIFIAFSGSFEFANPMLVFLSERVKRDPRLKNLEYFSVKAPRILNFVYEYLVRTKGRTEEVSFMLAGMDFSRSARDRNGRIVGLAIYDSKLMKVAFPGFKVEEASILNPILVMGSGKAATDQKLLENFKKLQWGRVNPVLWYALMIDSVLKEEVKKLKIKTVGGLSQIITIDQGGSGFVPYKTADSSGQLNWELTIVRNRYVQRNLVTGKELPLLYPYEVLRKNKPETELFAYMKS